MTARPFRRPFFAAAMGKDRVKQRENTDGRRSVRPRRRRDENGRRGYLTFFRQKLVIFVRTCTDDCVYKKWIFARKYDKISND